MKKGGNSMKTTCNLCSGKIIVSSTLLSLTTLINVVQFYLFGHVLWKLEDLSENFDKFIIN
jgi:hypothetical protein